MGLRLSFTVYLLSLFQQVISQARPLPITWASASYGPDGPWSAVEVVVGTNQGAATVNLYPGGSFDSNVLTSNFCENNNGACNAQAGGLYDPGNSPTADYSSIGATANISSWSGGYPMNYTGQSKFTLDTMKIASQSTAFNIQNAVFASVISQSVGMPNGSTYPVWLGNLALGSPNPVQTFNIANGTNVTGQLLTGYLEAQKDIPSSSFGLHIGSASLNQQGSLILGGYDQARIAGPIASYDTVGVSGDPIVSLIDIQIGVQTGGSPFNTTSIPSLYSAGGNKSTNVLLNPLIPYLSLPYSTCAAIAEWLPVTYNPNIGLYLWNTNDYRYKSIISSPAYLGFTFETVDNSNLTIKVPFSLLNLTLESPIVASSQQYFPCQPWNSPDSLWHLGRAFMQATFLGTNWEQNKFFVAQAVGPSGNGPTSIQTINPTDTTIQGGDASAFQSSWSSIWTMLPNNASTSGSAEMNSSSGGSGLSQGAKIGIGVGVALGGLLLILLVVFFCLRSRRRKEAANQPLGADGLPAVPPKNDYNNEKANAFGAPPEKHKHPYFGAFGSHPTYRHELQVPPGELDAPNKIHEADPTRQVHEAPSHNYAYEIDSNEISSPASARSRGASAAGAGARSSPGSGGPSSPTSSSGWTSNTRGLVSAYSRDSRFAGRDSDAIVSPQTPAKP